MLLKILLSGDGGQGIQTIADIICRAVFENNWFVSHVPNYGLEQRGGVSLSYIQISDEEIIYSKFKQPDILVIMSDQARERIKQYAMPQVTVFDIKELEEKMLEQKIAKQSFNIYILGLLAKVLEEKNIVAVEKLYELVKNKLEKKNGWQENNKAFEMGKIN